MLALPATPGTPNSVVALTATNSSGAPQTLQQMQQHNAALAELLQQAHGKVVPEAHDGNCYRPVVSNYAAHVINGTAILSWSVSTNPQCGQNATLYYRIENVGGEQPFQSPVFTMDSQLRVGLASLPLATLRQPNLGLGFHTACDHDFTTCSQLQVQPATVVRWQ
jgi:hypothetical protein